MRKAGAISMPIYSNQEHTMEIGNHLVRRLDSVRALLIDDKELKFTPTEYCLLLRLLRCDAVSDTALIDSLFSSHREDDLWARETMNRHMDNVRRKFKQHRLPMAIHRIATFGYI